MVEAGVASREPTTVAVDLGPRSYEILIGRGLIDRAGEEIAARLPDVRLAIVTDDTVARHHLSALTNSLDAAGLNHVTLTVPPGEGTKSFAMLQMIVDRLLAERIGRSDAVVPLGGGVVGDLAGFAAAVTLRGLRVVQIPTTLLAQVDSSVGGKTGINTERGKNLVGAFHQPEFVLADTGILDSLPPRIFNAGYAEVAKYGLIGDADFFTWLESNWRAIAAGWDEREHAIAFSCRAKADIVKNDEREHGARALLNLGHTFGHALESATGYSDRLLHGEAVAIGMVLAHRFSVRLELCPVDHADRVVAHLRDVGLPTRIRDIPGERLSVEAMMTHIAQDKKAVSGSLTFILTHGIGMAFIARDVSGDDVAAFLAHEISA